MTRTCVKKPPTFQFEQWDGTNIYDLEMLVLGFDDGYGYFDSYEWQGFMHGYIHQRGKDDLELAHGNVVVVSNKGKLEVFHDMSDFAAKYEEVLDAS